MKQILSIYKKFCCIKNIQIYMNEASDSDDHDPDWIEHPDLYSQVAMDQGDPLLQESEHVLKPVYLSINWHTNN